MTSTNTFDPVGDPPCVQQAQYAPSEIVLYQGNALIEALEDYPMWSAKAILKKMLGQPPACTPRPSYQQARAWLTNLPAELFIPIKRHFVLFEMIDLLIRQGYRARNPELPERAKYLRDAYERLEGGKPLGPTPCIQGRHEQLTATLIGTSGMGKTWSVNHIFETFYPQVIRHRACRLGAPLLQITHLHVECPPEGSVITLCKEIIDQVGYLSGIDYRERFRITDRTTLDTLKSTLVHVLAIHYVGIIVIDEIQNLVAKRSNKDGFFNFIVALSNSINVPVLFVGTPLAQKLMNKNFRTARRLGTRGFIHWQPLAFQSHEWRMFIDALWTYNVLRDDNPEKIPEDVEQKLWQCSFGITEVLLKLFIASQLRVLVVSAAHRSQGKMTVQVIEQVFNENFKNIKPIIEQLIRQDEAGILSYEDLDFPKCDDIAAIVGDIDQPQPDMQDTDKIRSVQNVMQSKAEFVGNDAPDILKEMTDEIIAGQSTDKER